MKFDHCTVISKLLIFALGVQIVAIVAMIYIDTRMFALTRDIVYPNWETRSIRSHKSPYERYTSESKQLRRLKEQAVLPGVAYLPATIGVQVLYLIWVYGAHTQLKKLNAVNLRFSNGWAVGYHFVPFWNFVRPYQIVREIWHGSAPDAPRVNDCSKGVVRSRWFLRVWWLAFVCACFFGTYAFLARNGIQAKPNPTPSHQNAEGVEKLAAYMVRVSGNDLILVLLLLVSQMLLAWIVWSVHRRQAARFKMLGLASE